MLLSSIFICVFVLSVSAFRRASLTPRRSQPVTEAVLLTRGREQSAKQGVALNMNRFNLDDAVILAGYSFQAYNDESTSSKATRGLDGTIVSFRSPEMIRSAFAGVLLGTLRRAECNKQFNEQLLERVISGESPDAYVQLSVRDRLKPTISLRSRMMDSFTSSVIRSYKPSWNESFSLYIQRPPLARVRDSKSEDGIDSVGITVEVWDRDYLKSDDLLGTGEIPLWLLLQGQSKAEKTKNGSMITSWQNVPVPVYQYISSSPSPSPAPDWGWFSWLQFKRERRIRTGTAIFDLQYVAFPRSNTSASFALSDMGIPRPRPRATGEKKTAMPVGATEGLSWATLLNKMTRKVAAAPPATTQAQTQRQPLLSSLSQDTLLPMCFLENPDTDTQAGLWADMNARHLVVSFRGTEQAKLRDVLTDVQLQQQPYGYAGTQAETWASSIGSSKGSALPFPAPQECLVHRGFLSSFNSVLPALLQLVELILGTGIDNGTEAVAGTRGVAGESAQQSPRWTIYVTGHSLGGALATLFSFELALLQNSSTSATASSALPALLRDAQLCCYTYGAPRVGCSNFAALYDALMPKGSSYRIVNSKDVVPRLPRSSSSGTRSGTGTGTGTGGMGLGMFEYKHAGKTVMVGAAPATTTDIDTGTGSGTGSEAKAKAKAKAKAEEPTLWVQGENEGDDVCPLSDYEPFSFPASGQTLSLPLPQSLLQATATATPLSLTLPSLDPRFIEQELALWRSLVEGAAVADHLEPSYYRALEAVVDGAGPAEST